MDVMEANKFTMALTAHTCQYDPHTITPPVTEVDVEQMFATSI